MGLQQGYGDHDPFFDYEQYLLDNERLLKLKAAERLRKSQISREIWDDVLQEGRIVQWRVLKDRPSSTKPYVSAAMSHRMTEVIKRDSWTGSEAKRGHPIDPLRRRDERDSVDDETLGVVELVVSSSRWLDEVLIAYHHGEIMHALNALTFTQRRYVYLRFWEQWTVPEIAEELGMSVQSLERQWRTIARPALVEQLKHLAGV